MRKLPGRAALTALGFALAGPTLAGSAAQQTVTFSVVGIDELRVSGNPGPLTVDTASAGEAPVAASDASTSYALTANQASRKITAALDSPMPAGISLAVFLAAPAGAASAGTVVLGAVSADVVTGIGGIDQAGMSITYTLQAQAAAGTIAPSSRAVTFTLTAGS